jgi:hypothetical protein
MPLRVEVRLPSQAKAVEREVESSLQSAETDCPSREVWVIAVLELPDQEEWLMLATGGVHKSEADSGWAFVTLDTSEADPICTYSCVLAGDERDPAVVKETLHRLLSSPTPKAEERRKNGRGRNGVRTGL